MRCHPDAPDNRLSNTGLAVKYYQTIASYKACIFNVIQVFFSAEKKNYANTLDTVFYLCNVFKRHGDYSLPLLILPKKLLNCSACSFYIGSLRVLVPLLMLTNVKEVSNET